MTTEFTQYYTIEDKDYTYLYNKKGVHIVEYTFEFLWETKEEYLAFRDEWKAQYKELSARLKKAKHAVKDAMRQGGGWREQGHVMSLKSQAHMLLQMREQGKRVSREQARQLKLDKQAANA